VPNRFQSTQDPRVDQNFRVVDQLFPVQVKDLAVAARPKCFSSDLDFFGPEPRASNALVGDASASGYNFPGSALSASTRALPHFVTASVINAVFDVAWNPQGDEETGIQLISFKEGPSEIKEIHSFTGSKSATPIHSTQDVTAALSAVWEEARSTGTSRFLGHRLKSHTGVIAPIVFMSRVVLVLG
jgi:hypothetical protein